MFVATKAFIEYNGKILLVRESDKYADGVNVTKYDVVGGRVEPGQRFDESLLREIKEETGLDVQIGQPFFVSEWRPVVRGEQWQIVGIFFQCQTSFNEVVLSGDHDDYQWIDPKDFGSLSIIPNLVPAFEAYNKMLGK